jgi:hypothetical protein
MKTHRRLPGAILLGLLVTLLMASAAMAKGEGIFRSSTAGLMAAHQGSGQECDSQDEGTSEEQESDDQGTSEDQESDDQHCDVSDEGSDQSSDPSDRLQACREAAGITDGTEGDNTSDAKMTGLDHAVEVVMANCIKNPRAPGLLNALRHLVANRDRHNAHEEAKAARRAAHDAAKAARQASKGTGNGHGSGD